MSCAYAISRISRDRSTGHNKSPINQPLCNSDRADEKGVAHHELTDVTGSVTATHTAQADWNLAEPGGAAGAGVGALARVGHQRAGRRNRGLCGDGRRLPLALPQTLRWGTWGAAVAAAATALGATVVWPAFRRRSAFELAAAAERGQGGMHEQLTGAVALLGNPAPAHGSPSLIAAVAERAAEQVGQIEPASVVPWGRTLRRAAIGAAALGLLAAPLLFWPDDYGKLTRHFLMPWSDVERPGRYVIAVLPGEKALPVGADLAVSASVRARLAIDRVPGEAYLEWAAEGEATIHRVPMPAAAAQELDGDRKATSSSGSPSAASESASARDFAITLPRLARSIWYRVASGNVKSPRYAVTVVEPPSVAAIAARVEPPEYTRLPVTVVTTASRIAAFEGSKVILDIKGSRPVRTIEVSWPVGAAESVAELARAGKFVASLDESGGSGSVTVEAVRSGPFAVTLADRLGILSGPDEPRRVVVRADLPPIVGVRGPDGVQDAGPKDTLGVAVAARDDIAVASVELHYTIERGDSSAGEPEAGHVDVAVSGLGSRSARGVARLALAHLGLKPGDSLSYRIRVADNRPAPRGPNVVWTESRTLSIVAGAEPLHGASRARAAGLRSRLEALKKDVIADRDKTEHLRQAADAVRAGRASGTKPERQALDGREAATREIEDNLKLLARELDAEKGTQAVARAAQEVAQVEAEAARAGIEACAPRVRPGCAAGGDRAHGRAADHGARAARGLDAPGRRRGAGTS